MELVKNNKQEEITSIHNYNKKQQEKEEILHDQVMKVFMEDIYSAMRPKEKYEVFYSNPSTERLEEIMERVIVRAQIRKEILLEKLS